MLVDLGANWGISFDILSIPLGLGFILMPAMCRGVPGTDAAAWY